MFKVFYKKVIGLEYKDRTINKPNGIISREDEVYEILVKKYFYNKIACEKIMLILEKFNLKTSTELAFLSYVYALNHKWDNALESMEKVIYLEKGKNIDSFIDYGHFLRKIDKYEDLSNNLLLDLDLYMKKYSNKYKIGENISIINILNDK